MNNVTTIVSSYKEKKYFFTTNHCQKHDFGEDYVPCSYTLPIRTVKSEIIPDGVIRTIHELIAVHYSNMQEIDNPDVNLQPQK